jgi:hypothetical protein
MVKGDTLDRAATQAGKLKSAEPVRSVPSDALTKVVTPKAGVDYQPVTWERRVSSGGVDQVIGTLPDGTHVSLQKPVYDTLHAAAGPDGTIVAAAKGKTKDDRLFAHNAKGEVVGAGMPIRVDQGQARVFARGVEKASEAPKAVTRGDQYRASVAELDARKAPDSEYRSILSTGAKDPLRAGETWRGRVLDFARQADAESKPRGAAAEERFAERATPDEELPAERATPVEGQDELLLHEAGVSGSETPETHLATAPTPAPTAGTGAGPRSTLRDTPDAMHFSRDTSPYGEVFRDAGVDPNWAVNQPIAVQAQIARAQVKDTFGFKDVVGNLRSIDQRDALANFYQNGKGMANVHGMPYGALGLDGRITLSLEKKQGPKGPLGWYAPGTRTIHLPDRSNSFAHEWTHAWDHYLAEELMNNPKAMRLLSETASLRTANHVPGSTSEAFAKVIGLIYGKDSHEALETLRLQHAATTSKNPAVVRLATAELLARETEFARRSREYGAAVDAATGKSGMEQYYYRPAEMLARLNEAYTAHQVELNNLDTRGIVKPDRAYTLEGREAISQAFEELYPKEDRPALFEAMKQLYEQQRHEQILGPEPVGDAPSGRDIADPAHWNEMANTKADPKETGFWRREVNAQKNWLATFKERLGYDPERPKSHVGPLTRTADMGRALVGTTRGNMEALTHRQPEGKARDAFQRLTDMLSPAHGVRSLEKATGRMFGETFEEAVRKNARSNTNSFVNILTNHDLNNMTNAQANQMWRVMTSQNTKGVPQNIIDAAGEIRFILNREHRRNEAADIKLGYTPNAYFPRVYDHFRIFNDPMGFRRDAAKAYGHVYDRDVTTRAEMLEKYSDLHAHTKDGVPDPVKSDIEQLRRGDRELVRIGRERAGLEQGIADGTSKNPAADQARIAAIQARTAALIAEGDRLHAAVEPEIKKAYSTEAAHDWSNRIVVGDPTEYDTTGPASTYTKGRVLTEHADEILGKWMVNDPRQAIPMYFQQSARRIAYAERFGADGQKLRDIFNQAEEGGARGEDIHAMRGFAETVLGRQKSEIPSQVRHLYSGVHALGSMAMMTKASIISLGEPMAAIARTGRVRDALNAYAYQIGDIFNTAGSKNRQMLANALGITTSPIYDSIINDRIGAHYNDAASLARLSSYFYRRIGLTQLTNSQRRSMMQSGHNAMTAWADDLLNGSANAKREAAVQFRDLGVADKYQADLAQWLLDKKGNLPTLKDLENPKGNLWGQAVRRLTDQIIQDPYKVDKPAMASSNGVGRLMFGLMGFNYAFYHNIVEGAVSRQLSRISEAEGVFGKVGATASAAKMLATASAGIYAASLVTTIGREAVFNQTAWQEHSKKGDLMEWLNGLAIQRTGINGPLDPVIQAVTSLRYEKSFSSLTAGAQAGFFLDAFTNMIKPFSEPSPHTNTSHYNSARGFYQGLIVPLETAALSALPGGPLTGPLYGAAMMYLAGRGASERFAEMVTGPKGSTDPDAKLAPGEVPGERVPADALPEDTVPEDKVPEEGEQEAAGGGGGGGTFAGIPLGILDDLAAPVARIAPSVWKAMPGSLKLITALVAGTISLAEVKKEYGRFTEPP